MKLYSVMAQFGMTSAIWTPAMMLTIVPQECERDRHAVHRGEMADARTFGEGRRGDVELQDVEGAALEIGPEGEGGRDALRAGDVDRRVGCARLAQPSRFSIATGSSSQAGSNGSRSWASLRATPTDQGTETAPWTASTIRSMADPTVSRKAVTWSMIVSVETDAQLVGVEPEVARPLDVGDQPLRRVEQPVAGIDARPRSRTAPPSSSCTGTPRVFAEQVVHRHVDRRP